jgi:hypothetical protein
MYIVLNKASETVGDNYSSPCRLNEKPSVRFSAAEDDLAMLIIILEVSKPEFIVGNSFFSIKRMVSDTLCNRFTKKNIEMHSMQTRQEASKAGMS